MASIISQPQPVFAVLTGDIIASTKLAPGQLENARNVLGGCVQQFRSIHPKGFRGSIEFFRGDAWQLLLSEPRWSLRMSLLAQAALKAELDIDTRVAIGIGHIDSNKKVKVSISTGEAFTLSGRAVDELSGYFSLTGALPKRAGLLAEWLPVVLHLCSGLTASWTKRQAEIVGHALLLPKPIHEAIAATLDPPVKKQTVTESLAGANWRILQEPIKIFEATDWASVVNASNQTGEKTCLLPNRSKGLSKSRKAASRGRNG